jgi:hypothetical protein
LRVVSLPVHERLFSKPKPVCSDVRARIQVFFLLEFFRELRVCYFVAPSLTRGRTLAQRGIWQCERRETGLRAAQLSGASLNSSGLAATLVLLGPSAPFSFAYPASFVSVILLLLLVFHGWARFAVN